MDSLSSGPRRFLISRRITFMEGLITVPVRASSIFCMRPTSPDPAYSIGRSPIWAPPLVSRARNLRDGGSSSEKLPEEGLQDDKPAFVYRVSEHTLDLQRPIGERNYRTGVLRECSKGLQSFRVVIASVARVSY